MRLLREGAEAAGFAPERIREVGDEAAAAEACLRMAREGDVVVLLPTDVERIWRQVLNFRPGDIPRAAPLRQAG
jgi:cyanophycin synthetase